MELGQIFFLARRIPEKIDTNEFPNALWELWSLIPNEQEALAKFSRIPAVLTTKESGASRQTKQL